MRKELIAPCGMNCCICMAYLRETKCPRESASACARACCRGKVLSPPHTSHAKRRLASRRY
jgi:hypothetical protein